MTTFVFDAGGTNVRLGYSTNGRTLKKWITVNTPRTWTQAKKLIKSVSAAWNIGKIQTIVGGVPGMVDQRTKVILDAPHLRGWEGQPMATDLRRMFQARVMIENDAAVAGVGEARFGSGLGFPIVAYITVSTGVGGARIVEGQIDRRSAGFEPGHQLVRLGPGKPQTLEQLVSGGNIRRRYGRAPETIHDVRIWKRLATELAFGLVNVIELWSPSAIVLGGGVMARYKLELPLIKKTIRANLQTRSIMPMIRLSKLGDRAGLFGALALAIKR